MGNFFRHSIRAVVFILLLVPMLMLTSMLFVPKDNLLGYGYKHSGANGILGMPENTVDILILGDSESYRSFSPLTMWEEQGIASYCCGTPSQKLYYTEEFLHKAFEKQSPHVVILETNTIFKEFSYDDSALHNISEVMPVFGHHNRWKSITSRDLQPINYTHIDLKRGFQLKTIVQEASTKNYMKKNSGTVPIPDRNLSYVKDIKSFCDENGAQLIFVSSPSTKNWNMKKHNSIDALSKELGITYIDTNLMKKEIPIDWKNDSYDKGDHINYFGAVKVSKYFAEYFIDNGLAVSHKGEEAYKSWDEDVVKFHEKVEKSIQNSQNITGDVPDVYEEE